MLVLSGGDLEHNIHQVNLYYGLFFLMDLQFTALMS